MATMNRSLIGVSAEVRVPKNGRIPSYTKSGGIGGSAGAALAGFALTAFAVAAATLTVGGTTGSSPGDINYRYVGPAATGNGTGTNWANMAAWGTFTPVRGLTYYVRGGNFNARIFNTANGTGTTRITIKKATLADHGEDVSGAWNPTWGTTIAAITGTMDFRTSYWTLDGTEGGGPGSWLFGHGFSITQTASTAACITLENTANMRGLEFKRIRFVGMDNRNTAGGSMANDGIKNNNGAEFLVQRCHFLGIGRCPVWSPVCRTASHTVELNCVQTYWGSELYHSELAAVYGITGAIVATYRHNLILHIDGTGGVQWDNSGNHSAQLRFYGNVVYYRAGDPAWWAAGNGIVGGWTGGNGEDTYNIRIYNNTFYNTSQSYVYPVVVLTRSGDLLAQNNVYVNAGSGKVDYSRIQTHDYNHAVNTPGGVTGEANGTTSATDPYDISANLDFTVKSGVTIPSGLTLPAPYDVDMYGNQRQPGNWSRGAIQKV